MYAYLNRISDACQHPRQVSDRNFAIAALAHRLQLSPRGSARPPAPSAAIVSETKKTPLKRGTAAIPLLCLSHEKEATLFAPFESSGLFLK